MSFGRFQEVSGSFQGSFRGFRVIQRFAGVFKEIAGGFKGSPIVTWGFRGSGALRVFSEAAQKLPEIL